MKKIDLNCDMGENIPGEKSNFDEEIMPFISSCNIACGFHSGHPKLIERTIKLAIAHQVKIGAHPSYNDRENFGRISLQIDRDVLMAEIRYQICALKGMTESFGAVLHHVKPHGALYNDMVEDRVLAEDFVKLVKEIDPNLKVYTLAHSQVMEVCAKLGIIGVNEGFADRRYDELNKLRNRTLPGAVLHNLNEVLDQVELFLEQKVQLYSGKIEAVKIDSICLHGDTRGAVELSKNISQFLSEKNVEIAAVI
ncbi:5-oxoprolinase subunit PxpA [Namhaeicola litoreus]|uniref:5-oxoprolinase subunit PxpA n=1 Tax=Namhaeicola litoreus TaxID=1052145 RepID=A0ABW3XZ01_9FLAO